MLLPRYRGPMSSRLRRHPLCRRRGSSDLLSLSLGLSLSGSLLLRLHRRYLRRSQSLLQIELVGHGSFT